MTKKTETKQSFFGFQQVDEENKKKMVEEIFDTVSSDYDLMNDILSLGAHRLWKRAAVNSCKLRPNYKVLDLAGGTGDMVKLMSSKVGEKGLIILSDINKKMLETGRDNIIDKGINNVISVLLDAEELPFKENSFDVISIAFGLRNLSNKQRSLESVLHCLKPGGEFVILEFSKPTNDYIRELYDLYSYEILPKVGEIVANSEESYRYLAESIRMHPNQEELLKLMQDTGYTSCQYENLSNGIVAIHKGIKPK